jgi:hypothetical protein
VTIESDGRSLLVTDVGPLATPDELRVTREAGAAGDAPLGPAVLEWQK